MLLKIIILGKKLHWSTIKGKNRFQVYKIGNEAFFAINDQVIQHIPNIESKGSELKLVTGKSGIQANYVKAHYLSDAQKINLKENLKSQLTQFNNTGLHYKIAKDYQKFLSFLEPENRTNYFSNQDTFSSSKGHSIPSKHCYSFDTETKKLWLPPENKNKAALAKNVLANVEITLPNKPVKILKDYYYIGYYKENTILVMNPKLVVYQYDYEKDTFIKLFKAKWRMPTMPISENLKYLVIGRRVYDIEKGEEVSYKTNFIGSGNVYIDAVYDDKIVASHSYRKVIIDLKTQEIEDFTEKGIFKEKYFLKINGRELTIKDMSTGKNVAENIQLLTLDRNRNLNDYGLQYFPEFNEVYVSSRSSSSSDLFYFFHKDEFVNTFAFVVNTKTNEITPFLAEKTIAERLQEKEATAARILKGKIEVENFLSPLKKFGKYYELNYNNIDYINVSNDPLLTKFGVVGTTYAIGKFCQYNGGEVLALGITKDQYVVELLRITHGFNGAVVTRQKLGFTQNVNGLTTQIATVKVYQNSTDKAKYTLVVNDGRETKIELTSDCK